MSAAPRPSRGPLRPHAASPVPPDAAWLDDAEHGEPDARGVRLHDDAPRHPDVVATDQVGEAITGIGLAPSAYLHFPWGPLDDVVGGMPPGDVWFVCAFSGNGKTTFLASALDAWFDAGLAQYVMGLESRPKVIRTQWACKRLGLDAGDALSGALRRRALAGDLDARDALTRLRDELTHQAVDATKRERVVISGEDSIDHRRLRRACEAACDLGADAVIVDHIDHIEGGDGSNLYAESVRTCRLALTLAQRLGLKLVLASQLNNDAVRGDRLAAYQPPQPHHVFMGSHKRQIASGMLGLFRPLKFGGATKDELLAVRHGEAEPQTVLEPNVMGVVVMKHRLYGAREGRRVYLGVHHGRVGPLPPEQARALQAGQHRIRTSHDLT